MATVAWAWQIVLLANLFCLVRMQSSCDADRDCTETQFCSGSSQANRVARSATYDLITETLNLTAPQTTPLFLSRAAQPFVTSGITLFGRVRQEPGNNGWLIAKGRDTVERDYGLYLRGSHDQMWFVFNPIDRSNRPPNELYKPVFKLGLGVDDNEWHTVAASFDPANDRVEFFIDGELRAVEIETLNPNYRDSKNLLAVGGRAGGEEFTFRGEISVARVYSTVLTEAQVLAAHQEALLGPQRLCTDYRTVNQACDLCSSAFNCSNRCAPGLSCVATTMSLSDNVVVPVSGTAYMTPPLTGWCTAACPCPAASATQTACGRNGITYESQCFATCAGQMVLHSGTCIDYEVLAREANIAI